MRIYNVDLCECGAITIAGVNDNGEDFSSSVLCENVDMLPDLIVVSPGCIHAVPVCNHCANHWGLDLCACGSGLSPDRCDCGDNRPYDKYGLPRPAGGWDARMGTFKKVHDDTSVWCDLHECVHSAEPTDMYGDGVCSEGDWQQLYIADN